MQKAILGRSFITF